MDGLAIVQGLIKRGYTPFQAAALGGHALQESGGNPASVNADEDAHGLLQWRGSRWQGLQDYAKAQGKSPTDPDVQLDYVGKEMSGPEAKSSAAFMAAPDVASASAALKPYIRFGDNSDGTRLNNATNLYSQFNNGQVGALASGPVDPTNPADPTQSAAAVPGAPVSLAAPAPVGSLSSQLQSVGSSLGGGQKTAAAAAPTAPDFLPDQQIQMARPMTAQSQQIAAALAKAYGA